MNSNTKNNHLDTDVPKKPRGCRNSKCIEIIRKNLLLLLTLVGIVLGVIVGFIVRPFKPSQDAILWLGLPGELFMRLLNMMILPLIICSVISGTASLNPKSNGKISAIAFLFCLTTNFISCLIGLVYTLIIRPARYVTADSSTKVQTQLLETQDIFADLIRNLVPDNIVQACFQQAQTKYKREPIVEDLSTFTNTSDVNATESLYKVTKYVGHAGGANILGLVVVCVLIGIAVNKSEENGKPFLAFFSSATEVVLCLLRWLLWYTPIGVFSLIAVSLANIENLETTFTQLGLLVVTVTVGVATHQLAFIPLVLFFLTGRNPYKYLLSISRAWMLAFASTSTAVAIPEMIQACEGPNKIDKRVSRFVVPFCVTLNADGSAIYITSATLFVATVTGNPPDVSIMIIVVILTSIAAMAIPSVPSASIVTLIIILTSINVPASEIGFLFAVEWFLDRIRTTSNVFSHTSCAAVVYRFCEDDLDTVVGAVEDDVELEVLLVNQDSSEQKT